MVFRSSVVIDTKHHFILFDSAPGAIAGHND